LPGDMGGGMPGGMGGELPGDMRGGLSGGMGGGQPGGMKGGQSNGGSTPGAGGSGGTGGGGFTGHSPDGMGGKHEDGGFGGGGGGGGGTTVSREAGFINVSDLPSDMQSEWHDAEADAFDNILTEQADQMLNAKDPNVPGVKGEDVPESELFAPPPGTEGGDDNAGDDDSDGDGSDEDGADDDSDDDSGSGDDNDNDEDKMEPGDEGSGGGEKPAAIEDFNWSKVDGLLAVDPPSPDGGGDGSGFDPKASGAEATTTEEGVGGGHANPNAAKKFDPSVITDPDQEQKGKSLTDKGA
jgi:hypothetical protein